MVFPKHDRPTNEIRAAHLDFISANWDMLAKLSYENFLAHGPGLVLADESDFIGKQKGILAEIKVGYMSKDDPKTAALIQQKERNWLATYDAETTLLIVFIRGDEGVSGYKIAGVQPERTPKRLYQRSKE